MTEWTRKLPAVPGLYWVADDHWTDGAESTLCRVFADNDGVMQCLMFGSGDSVALDSIAWPSYWTPAHAPRPVFNAA